MNLRSFKSRLLVWYAACLIGVFVVTGGLIYLALSNYLERNLADSQTGRANRISGLIERLTQFTPEELASRITADFAPEAGGRFIRVSDAIGKVFYVSGTPYDRNFQPEMIDLLPAKAGERRIHRGATEIVVVMVKGDRRDIGEFFVESGESLLPARKELRRLLFSLGVGFAVVAVAALLSGWFLIKHTLRPVEEITKKAESITSRNLGERLPVPPTGDQFEHLSRALNRMISRLDEAFCHNHRFLADASHELRTPLTILRSEVEQLLRVANLEPRTLAVLETVLEEVERLGRIVQTLFDLSRLEAGRAHAEHKPFDLAKLALETTDQLCLLAKDRGLKIECQVDHPVFIEGDRARLKQVIVNLLDNAIKYTAPDGLVTLKISDEAESVVCEVTDTGIGIPAKALPHIFDRFYRVDDARSRDAGGAGIGLSIVKIICAAHGGSVEAASVENQGSRFFVRLPRARASELQTSNS